MTTFKLSKEKVKKIHSETGTQLQKKKKHTCKKLKIRTSVFVINIAKKHLACSNTHHTPPPHPPWPDVNTQTIRSHHGRHQRDPIRFDE